MNEMPNAVIDMLSGRASLDDLANRVETGERDLIDDLTGSLAPRIDALDARVRELEDENRALREALVREATLRAELLGHRRIDREPRRPRRNRARGRLRHRR